MQPSDFNFEELTKSLTVSFNILADEVQLLSDRKIILEHKLRYAHEQYQRLADKYAPGDAETSSTLAKLQLPPDLEVPGFVPLPSRGQPHSKQQTAVVIRDGRRAAQHIAQLSGLSVESTASGKSLSGSSSNLRYSAHRTSLSTVLEQDFTVEGKKGFLLCPFSRSANMDEPAVNRKSSICSGAEESHSSNPKGMEKRTSFHSPDPICAAMYADAGSSAAPSASGSAAKCPIRYLDQHSPEEVAAYFETHKHEIPRSHEICVRRYQRNEDDIRKLDAKYGNLVNMIQGLGQKHQPMLPAKEEEDEDSVDVERDSNERVENWAHAVSTDGVELDAKATPGDGEDDRDGRFDRPLKEIRVGESPSRPWGISVPIFDPPDDQRPISPPPAPVSAEHIPKPAGKCPFGHGQPKDFQRNHISVQNVDLPEKKCPVSHAQGVMTGGKQPLPSQGTASNCPYEHSAKAQEKGPLLQGAPPPIIQSQPTFIQSVEPSKVASGGPQMIFTGPVFIGYPMDQAVAFMQQYKGGA